MIQEIKPPLLYGKVGKTVAVTYSPSDYTDELYTHHGIRFEESLRNAVKKRKAEFLAGRICVREALKRLEYPIIDVGIGPFRDPLWPEGIVGSITHTENFACAILEHSDQLCSIGIDSQQIIDRGIESEIVDQVLSREEQEKFFPSSTFANGVAIAFAAKEAFFKCVFPFVGQYFEFHDVGITSIQTESLNQGSIDIKALKVLSPSIGLGWSIQVNFSVEDSFIHTLCSVQSD